MAGDSTVPLIEAISTDHVTLGGHFVAKPPPRSEEGGVVSVVSVELDRMITIPHITDGFLGSSGYARGQAERGVDWECLSSGVFIERLIVYRPPGIIVCLGRDHHP